MRIASILAAIVVIFQINLQPAAPAQAARSTSLEFASADEVLRWINAYRTKPDPAALPTLVKSLSRLGAFKDPESSGAYVGFIAGVLDRNPQQAEKLIADMFPLPAGDQWAIVRAIAYSGLPDWKELLRKFADRMPTRTIMIDKYLNGQLPLLYQDAHEHKPTAWTTVRSYTIDKITGYKAVKEIAIEPSPEVLDTYWGVYFATATYRPISRIITMASWSTDKDDVAKLTLGGMAKYTLASNATRDANLLAMLQRAKQYQSKPVNKMLDEVIEAAETAEVSHLHRAALAAIQNLQKKGPAYQRDISTWGQVGQGALALGCIAAAATGQVELGLPCVVAGGLSSAALSYWDKQ